MNIKDQNIKDRQTSLNVMITLLFYARKIFSLYYVDDVRLKVICLVVTHVTYNYLI